MHVALVQGKCQFFKVLKVKKAETSIVQVYLNIIFEYIWDASEKQAQFQPTKQDRRLCHFLEKTGRLSAGFVFPVLQRDLSVCAIQNAD